MVGIVWLYNFLKGRNDRFKGKIPLIISSVVVMIIGLILFISGWIAALAQEAKMQYINNVSNVWGREIDVLNDFEF